MKGVFKTRSVRESEMNDKDLLHYYSCIREAYNAAPSIVKERFLMDASDKLNAFLLANGLVEVNEGEEKDPVLKFKHPNPDIGDILLSVGDYVLTKADWWGQIQEINKVKRKQVLSVRRLADSTIHCLPIGDVIDFSHDKKSLKIVN